MLWLQCYSLLILLKQRSIQFSGITQIIELFKRKLTATLAKPLFWGLQFFATLWLHQIHIFLDLWVSNSELRLRSFLKNYDVYSLTCFYLYKGMPQKTSCHLHQFIKVCPNLRKLHLSMRQWKYGTMESDFPYSFSVAVSNYVLELKNVLWPDFRLP